MSKVSSSSRAGAQQAAPLDVPGLVKLVGDMKNTLGDLDKTFELLHDQSSSMAPLGPTPETAIERLEALQQTVKDYDKKQQARLQSIKSMIRNDIKVEVAADMRDHIRDQVKLEVARAVKVEMGYQMPEHLPVSLQTQAEESRRQLGEVKRALQTSEARRKNAALRPSPTNLADNLAVVLKPDGTPSKLYPGTLRSLFAYNNEKAKLLVKDFGLVDSDVLEKNLNRFMAHIGIRFELVPVPASTVSPRTEAVLMPRSE